MANSNILVMDFVWPRDKERFLVIFFDILFIAMVGGIGTAHATAQHSHRLLQAATTMLVSLAALLLWQTMPAVSWLTRPESFPLLVFARQYLHFWSNWGQHRCRQWYAASYASVESYCGWLFSSQAQTYCWAMDDSKLAAELDSHVCSSLHFHVQCTLHVNYHYMIWGFPTMLSSNFPERERERETNHPISVWNQLSNGWLWLATSCTEEGQHAMRWHVIQGVAVHRWILWLWWDWSAKSSNLPPKPSNTSQHCEYWWESYPTESYPTTPRTA